MPRKRMIDPGIWTNIQVTRLSVLQRLLCVGLVSNADDDGRLNGDPLYLKGIIFPHDNITPPAIEDQLKQIARQSLIVRYRVNKTRCIYLPDWNKPGSWCYQYIRERRPSTIPPPPQSTPLSTPPPTQKEPNPIQSNPKQGKKMICPDCAGKGEVGSSGHQRTCFTCKGKRLLWREDYELLKANPP